MAKEEEKITKIEENAPENEKIDECEDSKDEKTESESEISLNEEPEIADKNINNGIDNNMDKSGKFSVKWLLNRWFIQAFTGMAQGLFVTLIAGTIIKTLGERVIGDNVVGRLFVFVGQIASILMGAGIGAGMASHLKAPKLTIFSAIVAGFLGAYAEPLMGAKIAFDNITVSLNGSIDVLSATFAKGLPGNPISAYICALAAIEVGSLVEGKTKLDILIVPLTSIICGVIGCFVSIPFIYIVALLSKGIAVATNAQPFFMGIIIAVIMGVLLTLPTSSAAIWVTIATPIISGGNSVDIQSIYLAGGAAVVGCACNMVGFAVASFRENGWGGVISQGIGTSMLQIPNVMKKPVLFLPAVIASAICGPLSTCVFKLLCDASGGGMGTSGLVGVFGVLNLANYQNLWLMWSGIILLLFVLPAVISFLVSEFMRKKGWIKEGDLKLR